MTSTLPAPIDTVPIDTVRVGAVRVGTEPVGVSPADPRVRRDALVRLGAGSIVWLGLLLLTYWWVQAGGVQDLTLGAGAALTSLGRISGLVASALLLVQVLMMARVPVLEAAYGQDRLARLHRVVGFSSFNLMVVHVALITWGYAAGDLLASPGVLWRLILDYPGMLLAAAGTLALVMVVVTSLRAARRRLRYESWHLLHLYAYLGAFLALPHQLWTGQELMSSPGRTVFWWGLWGAAAGAVLVWRLGLPLWRSARHGLRVTSVVPEAPGVVSVYLSGHRLDRLGVEAGQFLSWRFLGPGWTRAHPYSLSAAPDTRCLRITVADAGDGSRALRALRPGTRALVEGPYGRLSQRARTRRRVALIGAGVGLTPLRALAEDLAPGSAVLLSRYAEHPLFARELDVLARETGLGVVPLPGPRRGVGSWLGRLGHLHPDAERLDDVSALGWLVPDIAERDVFLCGPDPWTALVVRSLQLAGVPSDQIHLESFRW